MDLDIDLACKGKHLMNALLCNLGKLWRNFYPHSVFAQRFGRDQRRANTHKRVEYQASISIGKALDKP